jgi:hypothetical protein
MPLDDKNSQFIRKIMMVQSWFGLLQLRRPFRSSRQCRSRLSSRPWCAPYRHDIQRLPEHGTIRDVPAIITYASGMPRFHAAQKCSALT